MHFIKRRYRKEWSDCVIYGDFKQFSTLCQRAFISSSLSFVQGVREFVRRWFYYAWCGDCKGFTVYVPNLNFRAGGATCGGDAAVVASGVTLL
jgi:hypothetical protein